jgi:hypothetical protein
MAESSMLSSGMPHSFCSVLPSKCSYADVANVERHSYAELEVTFLEPDEGGRSQQPWLDDQRYRPHIRVPPDETMLGVEFVDGPDGPAPVGTPVFATVRFTYEPAVDYSALKVGALIEVVEGNRLVARGRVSRR